MKKAIINTQIHYLITTFLFLLASFWITPAHAIPAFASKYDKVCSYCHTAWPQLNAKGREFKELGYRLPNDLADKKLGDILNEGIFPISGFLLGRPYDKKKSGQYKLRALYEVELFIGGYIGNKMSGYVEIEGEDENDFEPEIGPVVFTYHQNRAINFQLAYADAFWSDSYGMLGSRFRLTRGRPKIIDERFGEADGSKGRLRDIRQNLSLFGRPFKSLFYSVGISGVKGDAEGVEANLLRGRVAYDINKNFMLGTFAISGEDKSTNRNFLRWGLDFQSIIADRVHIQGAFLNAKDDTTTPSIDEKNQAASLQIFSTFKTKTGKPTWVPLLRFDSYERKDSKDRYDEVTLNLAYYKEQNFKMYAEFWKQLNVPSGNQNQRFTLQIQVGF